MEYLENLKTVALFNNIGAAEIKTLLSCVGADIRNVSKGDIVLLAGDKPDHIGIVLSGQFYIIREDFDGNRALISVVTSGEIFAESLCCAGVPESPVTVIANSDSAVLMLSFSSILRTCPNSCNFHTKLIQNMLELIASKNLQLQSRMEIVRIKSIRAKVIHYLESFIPKQGRNIVIPFNREELADFLCVERSALSHELARMKKDGLIEYKKNKFLLK